MWASIAQLEDACAAPCGSGSSGLHTKSTIAIAVHAGSIPAPLCRPSRTASTGWWSSPKEGPRPISRRPAYGVGSAHGAVRHLRMSPIPSPGRSISTLVRWTGRRIFHRMGGQPFRKNVCRGLGLAAWTKLACLPDVIPGPKCESGYFRSLSRRFGHGTEGEVDGGDHRLLA